MPKQRLTFWSLFVIAAREWHANNTARMGAALAYYAIFSLAPLLLFAVIIASVAYGTSEARATINTALWHLLGDSIALTIERMIEHAADFGTSLKASIVAFLFLVYGASNFFHHLRGALKTAWHVEDPKRPVLRAVVHDRIRSIVFIPLVGILCLVLFAGNAVLAAISISPLPFAQSAIPILDKAVFFALGTLLITILYKLLPPVAVAWRDVWIGAMITMILLMIGNSIIGLYVRHAALASVYGAAGSLVALLLWVYYSAQVFFYGAAFTRAYANTFGSRIVSRK